MTDVAFLADTNFLIYLLEGVEEAMLFANYTFAVSFVTEIELLGKKDITAKEEKVIRQLLSNCIIIDLNPQIKAQAIKLKQQQKIKLPDALVASTAMQYKLTVITADKYFATIPELDIILLEL
jgi:predicted nucleic acid-binding protein